MDEAYDKREHSAKREVDDLTNYQKLNSLDGAGVLVNPDEVPPLNSSEEDDDLGISIKPGPLEDDKQAVTVYNGDYNDAADFTTVDNGGKTNT